MFVGATGTVLAPFINAACRDRHEFVATSSVMMIVVHSLKVVVFGMLGFAFFTYLPLMATMIGAAFLGSMFGRSVLNRMPENVFQWVFQIVLTLLSLRLLYAGLSAEGLI